MKTNGDTDTQRSRSLRRRSPGERAGKPTAPQDVNTLQRLARDLALMVEIGHSLVTVRETETLLQRMVDGAVKLTGMGSSAIYLLDNETLRLEATSPMLPPDFPKALREAALSEHPHIGRALDSMAPVAVPDTALVDLTPAERAIAELRDLRSLLYLPLAYKDRAHGVLIVGSVGAARGFTPDELKVYQTLAIQAAMQLEETRLFEKNQRQIKALKEQIDERERAEIALLGALGEQKRIEATLRESQVQFQNLFESNPLSIGLYDAEGHFLRCNTAMCDLLGYTGEELAEIDPTHPNDRDAGRDLFHRLAAGEIDRYEREKRYIRRDGEIIWVQMTASRVQDTQGDLSYLMLVNRDITAHRQAEQRLLESETMLRLIFENAFDGINIYEELPETRSRRLVDCNERYAEIAGRSKAELLEIGNTSEIQVNLGPRIGVEENRRLRETQSAYQGMISWIRPDGQDNVVAYTAAPVTLGDRHLTIGIDRDITDRVRAEEQLQAYANHLEELVAARTEALEAAQANMLRQARLATLGQVAGGIAHELRTPLGAIKNAAYLINMASLPPDEPLYEAVQILNQEVARADRIISSLLDFTRPQLPQQQVLDIGRIVEQALTRLQAPPTLKIRSHIDPGVSPVMVDAAHLERILENLLVNAVQAMPKDGQLTVTVTQRATLPEITPPGFAPQMLPTSTEEMPVEGRWIAIAVTDTGDGIAPDHLPRIFEPLFTTKLTGIGLGLSLVKLLLQANDGGIAVTTAPEKGTTFEMFLPVAPVDPLVHPAPHDKDLC